MESLIGKCARWACFGRIYEGCWSILWPTRALVRRRLGVARLAIGLLLVTTNVSHAGGYTLETGDVLRISVFGEASFPQEVALDDQGVISLPLLGQVQASGLTTASLAHSIEEALRQSNLILEPFVRVEVSQYRPFFIGGAVARPGSYAFQPGITVRHALAIAGGFRASAAGETVPALQIADLRSQHADLRIDEYRLKVQLARLIAEAEQKGSFEAPPNPPAELSGSLLDDIVHAEQAQLEARLAAFLDDISYLEASLLRVQTESDMMAGTRVDREEAVQSQLAQLETARALREKGLTTNSNLMAVERAHNNYRADLAQVQLQATRAHQEALNLQSEIRGRRQKQELELIGELQAAQVQLAKVQSQLQYVADKLLFVSTYGEHRTFAELKDSVIISIFRAGGNGHGAVLAHEGTEVHAGDIVEVSVAPNTQFYSAVAPNQSSESLALYPEHVPRATLQPPGPLAGSTSGTASTR